MQKFHVKAIMAGTLVVLFILFVWPTLYKIETNHSRNFSIVSKINRITGTVVKVSTVYADGRVNVKYPTKKIKRDNSSANIAEPEKKVGEASRKKSQNKNTASVLEKFGISIKDNN